MLYKLHNELKGASGYSFGGSTVVDVVFLANHSSDLLSKGMPCSCFFIGEEDAFVWFAGDFDIQRLPASIPALLHTVGLTTFLSALSLLFFLALNIVNFKESYYKDTLLECL